MADNIKPTLPTTSSVSTPSEGATSLPLPEPALLQPRHGLEMDITEGGGAATCPTRRQRLAHVAGRYISPPIAYGVCLAGASAVSFGITTPLIARAGKEVGAFETAALLYAGATGAALVVRPFSGQTGRPLTKRTIPWLFLVGVVGGAAAPSLLAWGLRRTSATSASLALNLEAVFTVILARLIYKEPLGRRVGCAVAVMATGGVLVSAGAMRGDHASALGIAAVIGATATWAADNTLTRSLAEEKPLDVVAAKSALGALSTGVLAAALHEPLPAAWRAFALMGCGAVGYGLSLHLYLLAQRRMGAARTGLVFAIGPFVGAALAWAIGDKSLGLLGGLGAAAFVVGVYLHVTEQHSHRHIHEALRHDHAHRHDDDHHDHEHDPLFAGEHSHPHAHERIEHEHEHAPDVHHDHTH